MVEQNPAKVEIKAVTCFLPFQLEESIKEWMQKKSFFPCSKKIGEYTHFRLNPGISLEKEEIKKGFTLNLNITRFDKTMVKQVVQCIW